MKKQQEDEARKQKDNEMFEKTKKQKEQINEIYKGLKPDSKFPNVYRHDWK